MRAIRDAIEIRVKELVQQRLDAIRTDRTAHQIAVPPGASGQNARSWL